MLAQLFLIGASARAEDRNVQVYEVKNGGQITLYAHLDNCSEATITIRANLLNMSASAALPVTVDSAGRKDFPVVVLSVIDKTQIRHYNWHYDWKTGGRSMRPAKPYLYSLPYKGGPFEVTQGPHGTFSHNIGSQDEDAIDFAMPVGTEVYPARPGRVVAIQQDSDRGGPDRSFENDANYLVIKQEDGTFAYYAHLKQNGVLVRLGDYVTCDKPVALSGSTGFTTVPHLHFCVFNTLNGTTRRTWPVKFRLKDGSEVSPQEHHSY